MKEFSKFQVASFKRTAQNVYPLVRKKEKLVQQIQEATEELESIQAQIDAQQGYVKEVTGGYTTEDLIVREVTDTGKLDKNGNPVKVTTFKLKYPETIIPPVEEEAAPVEETESSNTINTNDIWQ